MLLFIWLHVMVNTVCQRSLNPFNCNSLYKLGQDFLEIQYMAKSPTGKKYIHIHLSYEKPSWFVISLVYFEGHTVPTLDHI